MSVEKLQANLPLTDGQGNLTPYALIYFQRLADKIDELEARIAALEP